MLRRLSGLLLAAASAIAVQWLWFSLIMGPFVFMSSTAVLEGVLLARAGWSLGWALLAGVVLAVSTICLLADSALPRRRAQFRLIIRVLALLSTAHWLLSLYFHYWLLILPLAGHGLCLLSLFQLLERPERTASQHPERSAGRVAAFWMLSFMVPAFTWFPIPSYAL